MDYDKYLDSMKKLELLDSEAICFEARINAVGKRKALLDEKINC